MVTPLYKLFLATRKEQGSAARSYEIVKRGVPKALPTRQYIIVVIGKNETWNFYLKFQQENNSHHDFLSNTHHDI